MKLSYEGPEFHSKKFRLYNKENLHFFDYI